MRKWHRWLVIFTGVFLVWIAATGVVGQVVSLSGGEEHHEAPPPGPDAGHRGPPDLYHFIIDLHSGNYFGPVGKVVSAVLGGAMVFFAISGMWMYIDMFRKRKQIGRSGIFWK